MITINLSQIKTVVIIITIILSTKFSAIGQYTIKDDDVEVTDGFIINCTYGFEDSDIIIPETLDGQTVIGIDNLVFSNKNLASIILPTTIETIEDGAFYENSLVNIDLSSCSALTSIGEEAFASNSLSSLDLSACIALITIGEHAFSSNELTSLDLSPCLALTSIGEWAFSSNELTNLDLSGCTALTTIGEGAFYDQLLTNLDLSGCSSLDSIGRVAFASCELTDIDFSNCAALTYIDEDAFRHNSLRRLDLSDCTALIYIGKWAFDYNQVYVFALPINSEYETLGWKDQYGAIYAGGDRVNDMSSFYYIPFPYTLTDNDVVVLDGIIQSCSYNFDLIDIIIPDTLDGQTVLGIAAESEDNGVFASKGIAGVVLPSTIVSIGDYAFRSNPLTILDLNCCTSLTYIGTGAFRYNSLSSLDFSDCLALVYIGEDAFYSQELTYLDLSACTALIYIGETAFFNYNNDNLRRFTLPIHSEFEAFGWKNDSGTLFSGGDIVNDLISFYYIPKPYTITDNDVEVIDGIIQSCSYNFEFRVAVISDTLDGQAVIGIADKSSYNGVFAGKGITTVVLPSSIQAIGDYSFRSNPIVSLDLSACIDLTSIGESAFDYNSLSSLDLSACIALITIGEHAFSSNELTSLDLSPCLALTSIGEWAFSSNELTNLDLSGCTALTSIGSNAFTYNSLTDFNLPTPRIPGYTLINWIDRDNNTYSGGDVVSDISTYYYAELTPAYSVNFTVILETDPIQGATITLTGYGTDTTNVLGQVSFMEVLPEADIAYTITTPGYDDETGTISVEDEDVIETIELNIAIGISDISEENIVLYPNPTNTLLTVETGISDSYNIEITSLNGQLIHESTMEGASHQLDLSPFQKGVYLITIRSKDFVTTKKIIKL